MIFKIFLFVLAFHQAEAKVLNVAFAEDRPPYVFEDSGVIRGLEIEIVQEALLLSGYEIKKKLLPARRLEIAVKSMDFDMSVGVSADDKTLYYSREYIEMKNFAAAKTAKGLSVKNVRDLKGKSIVAWPLAYKYLGPEFEKEFSPKDNGQFIKNYSEIPSSRTQNVLFWNDRADVTITDKFVFNFYRRQLAPVFDTNEFVEFNDIFHDKISFVVAFRSEKLRDQFDEGVRELKRSRRYQRIVKTYLN